MDTKTLIRWINKNFPEILIIRRGNYKHVKKFTLNNGSKVTIDFASSRRGHGCILSDTEETYVYKNFEKVIILFDYKKNSDNVWTLLHELGHHTSLQLSAEDDHNIIQNEINAWRHAFMFGERLGVELTFSNKKFIQNCLYSYLSKLHPTDMQWETVRKLGLMKKRQLKKLTSETKRQPFWVRNVTTKKLNK